MAKRVVWKPGDVFSIKVSEDLYTLAQMRENNLLQFFAVAAKDEKFSGVDLNEQNPLFCIFVAINRVKEILSRNVTDEIKTANGRPTPKIMLSAIFGAGQEAGANVIELSNEFSSVGARVLRKVTRSEGDFSDIYKYDMCGMYGNPAEILRRLLRYFETGVNWDESKRFVFGAVEPPKPGAPWSPPVKWV